MCCEALNPKLSELQLGERPMGQQQSAAMMPLEAGAKLVFLYV